MQHFTQKFLPDSHNDMWIANLIRRQDQVHFVKLRDDDSLCIALARSNLTSMLPLTIFPSIWTDFTDQSTKF